jgi:hypothetical protein
MIEEVQLYRAMEALQISFKRYISQVALSAYSRSMSCRNDNLQQPITGLPTCV